MSNNVMIDSSILIEFVKGNKKNLIVGLLSDETIKCFINETVISEFLYYYIAIFGGRSPMSTKSAGQIYSVFNSCDEFRLVERFTVLPAKDNVDRLVIDLMRKYNMLPNDAIMLATCKMHDIIRLASHDSDFIFPCKQEEIELLTEHQSI